MAIVKDVKNVDIIIAKINTTTLIRTMIIGVTVVIATRRVGRVIAVFNGNAVIDLGMRIRPIGCLPTNSVSLIEARRSL